MSFTVISELDEAEQLEAVERQDDQIAEAVYRMRKVAIEKTIHPRADWQDFSNWNEGERFTCRSLLPDV